MMPLATLGMNHVCPNVSGVVPHVGGPIIMGAPDFIAGGTLASMVGAVCNCIGPPDTIVTGVPDFLINGTMAAALGSTTAHGGMVTTGLPDFLI